MGRSQQFVSVLFILLLLIVWVVYHDRIKDSLKLVQAAKTLKAQRDGSKK